MAERSQPLILSPSRPYGLSLSYRIIPELDPSKALRKLADRFTPSSGVIGLGEPLVASFSKSVPGLRTFPSLAGPNCSVPSTQNALWVFLQGEQRSVIFDESEQLGRFSRTPSFLRSP